MHADAPRYLSPSVAGVDQVEQSADLLQRPRASAALEARRFADGALADIASMIGAWGDY